MQQFFIDDDVVALVQHTANPKPFESFNDALRRVLQSGKHVEGPRSPSLSSVPRHESKKTPTPSAIEWATSVPDLRSKQGLNTWKAVCDLLKIETAGDSARRRLKNWVRVNRPTRPPVPDID